jgi:hypothetical protein
LDSRRYRCIPPHFVIARADTSFRTELPLGLLKTD